MLAAGFFGFFVMLAYMAGLLIWFACGLACVGFLLVALFSMGTWLFTHDEHAFRTMLGYFLYAAGVFAVIVMLSTNIAGRDVSIAASVRLRISGRAMR